jgi:GR25 family glycosyltransferase involved in LPS biosynthesis
MELFQNTIYINLEHRKDRLEHITKQLENLGIQAERFNAVRTKDGAVGCSMSHIKCLELAKSRDYEYAFICEDDITFLNPEVLKDSLAKFHENKELEWDMLLIGGNNVPPYERIGDYCIRVSNCQTTTGYVVRKHYYDTLIQNFRESVTNLMRNPANKPEFALDMYWKRLQKTGRWYMLTPFTVVQCDSYSDIEGRDVDYRGLMLDMDKEWLFRRKP